MVFRGLGNTARESGNKPRDQGSERREASADEATTEFADGPAGGFDVLPSEVFFKLEESDSNERYGTCAVKRLVRARHGRAIMGWRHTKSPGRRYQAIHISGHGLDSVDE